MDNIKELVFNNSLVCALSAWFIAQFIKVIIAIFKTKRLNLLLMMSSGGMPSSHSSTVCALATSVGIHSGFTSAEFAIATIVAIVVMYDAAGIRRAAGEQAKVLNKMMDDLEKGDISDFDVQLKELLGHTPVEVLGGALLGIQIPIFAHFVLGI